MSQKQTLMNLLKEHRKISKQKAESEGVKNLRQQVYFLRKDGYNIINCGKQEYKLIHTP